MLKKILISFFAFSTMFLFAGAASAAVFNIATDRDVVNVGDRITANIRIDTGSDSINAGQATLQFPRDILEIVSVDKTGSVFAFWLEEPAFSNETGRLSFIGGAISGYSGKSLQVLKVVFVAKGAGKANLVFSEGAITNADGSGANVLSELHSTAVTVITKGAPATAVPTVIPAPVQITRPATPAAKLPAKPVLEVPLYPDASKWYNLSSIFSVKWDLPYDIITVATALNNNPTAVPSLSEGLFDNKMFPALDDGIWYLHVQFKNNVGWGPTNHYKILIDTAPPLPFKINVAEGVLTDNPAPEITYATGDQLSGLDHYAIRIGDGDPVSTNQSSYVLPLQSPGKKTVFVAAHDRAGNITSDIVDLEILPIDSPTIGFVTGDITDEQSVIVSGAALFGVKIKAALRDRFDKTIMVKEAVVDEKGNWQVEFEQPLKRGRYYVEVQTIDSRGAQSLNVKSGEIRIREKPILVIFGFGITQLWLFVFIIAVLILGFITGRISEKLTREQIGRRVLIVSSVLVNIL